jgi:hypothetical protein
MRATLDMKRPSFSKRGIILKTVSPKNQLVMNDSEENNKQAGMATNRMLFSCTWKLNKKKMNETLTNEYLK